MQPGTILTSRPLLIVCLGDEGIVGALRDFDRLCPQQNEESALQQLQIQLSTPMPFDLDELNLTQSDVESSMEESIQQYFKNRSDVSAVYLFGSCISGRERPDSDVDLAILVHPNALGKADGILEKTIVDLGRITRKDIHPMVLNSAGETALQQGFKKGRCILINKPDHFSRFKANAIVRIAEFDYYRRMIQKGFVRGVMEGVDG